MKVVRETSRAAAIAVTGDLDRKILRVLAYAGKWGAACWQIERLTGRQHESVSACITGLWKRGLIRATCKRSRTPSGRQAIVWVLSQRWDEKIHGGTN